MKNKVFSWIFKRELEELEESKKDVQYEKRRNDKSMETLSVQSEEQNELLKRIFKNSPHAEIIGFEKNTYDNMLVVKEADNNNVTLYLYAPKHNGRNNLPHLYGRIIERDNGEKSLFIDEVQAIDKGIGNGSILMQHIMKESRKMGLSFVSGKLSEVDKENFDYLEKFYDDHGYDVKFNEGRTSGSFRQQVTAADKQNEREKSRKNERPVRTMLDIER